jgi:hypothetical protein
MFAFFVVGSELPVTCPIDKRLLHLLTLPYCFRLAIALPSFWPIVPSALFTRPSSPSHQSANQPKDQHSFNKGDRREDHTYD